MGLFGKEKTSKIKVKVADNTCYGVMAMPAIMVNEKVVSSGKVLKTNDVEKLLQKYGG